MSVKVKPFGKLILILMFVGAIAAVKIFWWDKTHPAVNDKGSWTENMLPSTAHATYLKLAGSNTIGDSLGPALVRAYLISMNATDISVSVPRKDEKEISGNVNGEKIYIGVSAHGTSTGFSALESNTTDICMASAPVDDKTFEMFNTKASPEDLRSVNNEHVIGLDGIAVIVNANNHTEELRLEQLKKIFTGEITNWSDVPGAGRSGNIDLFRRDDHSGTFKMFTEMALKGQLIKTDAKTFEKSEDLVQQVGNDANGIGFVSYTFVKNMMGVRAIPVKAADNLPAIVPNALSIQTEKYPLCRRLFFYALHNSTNPHILPFIQFVESPAGQNIVELAGFINLSVNNDKPESLPGDPAAYKELLSGAKKISTEFRFRFGSPDLDTRAIADVDRLTAYLSQPGNRNKKVILAGFTDNVGNPAKNIALSVQRAQSVQKVLEKQSITVLKTIGLGSARPVHNNDNEMERSYNRRVEIWLKD